MTTIIETNAGEFSTTIGIETAEVLTDAEILAGLFETEAEADAFVDEVNLHHVREFAADMARAGKAKYRRAGKVLKSVR